ncbi:MAG: hypothetical protein NTV87_08165, partial [Ignavibacteriae bacterium]|nr:hypothetical protein [Ignavibacteriota bacterium]
MKKGFSTVVITTLLFKVVSLFFAGNVFGQSIDNCYGTWEGEIIKFNNTKSKIIITKNGKIKACENNSVNIYSKNTILISCEFAGVLFSDFTA